MQEPGQQKGRIFAQFGTQTAARTASRTLGNGPLTQAGPILGWQQKDAGRRPAGGEPDLTEK
jgi:hypothetical protein